MAKQKDPAPANEEKEKAAQKSTEANSPEPGTGTETQNNLPEETKDVKPKEPAQSLTSAPTTEEEKPKFEKTMDLRFEKKEITLADGASRLGNVLQQYHKSTDPEKDGKWVDIAAPED